MLHTKQMVGRTQQAACSNKAASIEQDSKQRGRAGTAAAHLGAHGRQEAGHLVVEASRQACSARAGPGQGVIKYLEASNAWTRRGKECSSKCGGVINLLRSRQAAAMQQAQRAGAQPSLCMVRHMCKPIVGLVPDLRAAQEAIQCSAYHCKQTR